MTRLYLITGFLGAGKTTFLHSFAGMFPGKKTAIIINEFGKKGVDGTLLRGLGAEVSEINNGSIFCACKVEQFEEAVQLLLGRGDIDLIFVEASGLADPGAVRSIFTTGRYEGLEYAGAICLVDALRFHKIYETARVCRMQLAVSDMVLINKTDLATREQIDSIRDISLGQRPNRPVKETAFGHFEQEWLEELHSSGDEGTGQVHARDIALQKLTLHLSGFDRDSLEAFLKMFAGDTYRVKGFVRCGGQLLLADCVGPLVSLSPFDGSAEETGTLVVLYGHGLPAKKSILAASERFPGFSVEIEK